MREMLEAGVHFGHRTRYWNPKMAPYIFGVQHKIHIINLDKTLPLYQAAINFVSSVAAKNGKILFVGTKRAAHNIIREEAIRCGMPYVNHRWLGGMLTNYKTVRQSIKRLKELEALRDSGKFAGLTKKEGLNLMRELTKLEHTLGGIKNMGGLPDAVFVVDVGHEDIVVSEANKLSIPIVGIVDTNRNPDNIDYIIPGNDDAVRAISFYVKNIADAIIEARATLVTAKKEKEAKEVKTVKKPAIKKKAAEKEKPAKTKTVKISKVKKDGITAEQVKELRERTGAGMMECKKALEEAKGDMEQAITAMRKTGQAKAAKKAGRIAAEGVVAIAVSEDNKRAFMAEINTETDFAARDASFKEFVDKVINSGLENKATDLASLMALPGIPESNEELVAKIGENIQIRRAVLLESEGSIGSYSHAGRIGVIAGLSTDDLQLGKDIAMHIAASKPEVVNPEDVSAATIDKEKQIYLAQASETGKPSEVIEKMVDGKIKKFINEISLAGQPFVKDPSITVGELLGKMKTTVSSFVRFEVGEGIEKPITDFAEEVKKTAGG